MKKILLFSNSDAHFYNNLLPIAIEAKNVGFKIKLLTSVSSYKEKIENHDIEVIEISILRGSMNPFLEISLLLKVIKILRKESPDIIHNFTIKPIVYGSIATLFCSRNIKIINNFLGLGYLFIKMNFVNLLIKNLILKILSIVMKFRKTQFIVQNIDDKKTLINSGIKNNITVQCSVGIDISEFSLLSEPKGKIIFALVARMLIDKGVREFVSAARILQKKNIDAEFWLVGAPDNENKSSLTEGELKQIHNENIVKYLGYQDISKIWKKAHVAVLPSYREGLSKSLLEAGAYGRAIITTNAPGGRDLITDNVNGLLVKPKDVKTLASAMEKLVSDNNLRKELANRIHDDIIEKYDSRIIAKKMVSFYYCITSNSKGSVNI